MEYMKFTEAQRHELLASLTSMHRHLCEAFESLDGEQTRTPGPAGMFSPVEQVWHLADLELEGFGQRIRRLQSESNPLLPDFDGARMARERDYGARSLQAGLRAFDAARQANVAALRTMPSEAWSRSGTQEGVGQVALCDMPMFMVQHDEAHKAEIQQWQQHVGHARGDAGCVGGAG